MNEFESDWISLSQSQSGGRVFLSESERRKQGVWIPQYRSWIQDGRIQEGHHNQVESEGMSEGFFVQMVGTNLGKCEWVWEEKLRWLIPRWPNSRWQNSRWLPSSRLVRMNEFESDWISLSQSQSEGRVFLSESERRNQGVWIQHCSVWIWDGRIQDGHHHQVESEWMSEVFLCKWWGGKCEWSFFCEMVGTNLGKYECVWEEKLWWLNPRWPNSRWQNSTCLPSSSWVRMNEFESD